MPATESIIEHPIWGRIVVRCNSRARRIVMRAKEDAIHMTVPPRATEAEIENALGQCGDRLKEAQSRINTIIIDGNYSIDAPNFKLKIKSTDTGNLKICGKDGAYTLYYPNRLDSNSKKRDEVLRTGIKAALKHRASCFLPQRLQQLASTHGFKYNRCTVRDTHTRWGSCSTNGNISLNQQLILLRDELIDYVLLHELCHTVEMSHSDRFWKLLDRYTAPHKAKKLSAEIKRYRTDI